MTFCRVTDLVSLSLFIMKLWFIVAISNLRQYFKCRARFICFPSLLARQNCPTTPNAESRSRVQDVVNHSRNLRKKQAREVNTETSSGLKSLNKANRDRLEAYQHLFYLLQVMRRVRCSRKGWDRHRFSQGTQYHRCRRGRDYHRARLRFHAYPPFVIGDFVSERVCPLFFTVSIQIRFELDL